MGTRADFYIGYGKSAEWLGSVAWDGYEWADGEDNAIASATTEKEFRHAVSAMLAEREDATLPEMGWPWPWETSATTDYSYYFDGTATKYKIFSGDWPEMSIKDFTLGKRSGVMIFGA